MLKQKDHTSKEHTGINTVAEKNFASLEHEDMMGESKVGRTD